MANFFLGNISSSANFFDDFCLQKMLHYLENSKRLKGKVKKEEEPDWGVIKGPKNALFVFSPLSFC
jgi:hypothetical protein